LTIQEELEQVNLQHPNPLQVKAIKFDKNARELAIDISLADQSNQDEVKLETVNL
jgi:hypothetical protein